MERITWTSSRKYYVTQAKAFIGDNNKMTQYEWGFNQIFYKMCEDMYEYMWCKYT